MPIFYSLREFYLCRVWSSRFENAISKVVWGDVWAIFGRYSGDVWAIFDKSVQVIIFRFRGVPNVARPAIFFRSGDIRAMFGRFAKVCDRPVGRYFFVFGRYFFIVGRYFFVFGRYFVLFSHILSHLDVFGRCSGDARAMFTNNIIRGIIIAIVEWTPRSGGTNTRTPSRSVGPLGYFYILIKSM